MRPGRDRDQGPGRRGGRGERAADAGPARSCCRSRTGSEAPTAIAAVLGEEAVVIGVAGGFGASIVGPGHVHHNGWELVRLGERHGPATGRIRRIVEVWEGAGFRVQAYDDVDQLVWEKLICNVTFSGTCAVLERTIGEVLDDPAAWQVASHVCPRRTGLLWRRGIPLDVRRPVAYVRAFGEKIPDAQAVDAARRPRGAAVRDRRDQRRHPARGARAPVDSAGSGCIPEHGPRPGLPLQPRRRSSTGPDGSDAQEARRGRPGRR